MSNPMNLPCRHPSIVATAAEAYEQYLAQVLDSTQGGLVGPASEELLESVRAARRLGAHTRSVDISFSSAALTAVPRDARALLLNQFALGLGRDDAPVVVIGTEHAYDLDREPDLVNFCMESCGGPILWLCGGDPGVAAKLSANAVRLPPDRPFHIYPNDHYRESGSHTWVRLAKILGSGREAQPGARPALGDLCYQIELSAHPAQKNRNGKPPTSERLQFLETALRVLAQTARVLLIHGRSRDQALHPARDRLCRAFLGTAPGATVSWNDIGELHRPVAFADQNGRRVIVTRAVANSGVTEPFLQLLRDLVNEAV